MMNTLFYRLCLALLVLFALISNRATAQSYIKPLHKVTLPQAHRGTLSVDTLLMDSYGLLPQNVREFYLNSRKVLSKFEDGDYTHPEVLKAAIDHEIPLMGGPMLGDLKPDSVKVWLRPATSKKLEIKLMDSKGSHLRNFSPEITKPGIETKVSIDGLTPDRKYYYSLVLDEKQITQGSFRTAPSPNLKGKVRLAFGADFHKVGLHNPNLFNQILKRDPLVMLLYGDSAVDGRRNKANMHRADYLLREISQPWKRFVSRTPVYATWDDWDYFSNDTNGIPKNYMASDRKLIRNVWKSNWNNPVNDPERKGIYFTTRIGPVEIFMLDTRSCRENNRRNQYTSYLGKEQHEWLKNGLKNSKAPFKIITSGTMWSDYVSNAKDTWGSWDTEGREELFSLIERDKIGGVLLLSGDRHGARGFKIPRKSGFEFYEFEVGTLGGAPGPPAIVEDCPEQIFGYEGTKTIAFGEFNFDTSTDNPNVTFYLIRDTGEILEEHILSLDQLTPKD